MNLRKYADYMIIRAAAAKYKKNESKNISKRTRGLGRIL